MTGLENQSQNVLNRWQYDGQETDVPRALWNDPIGNSDFSTRWIEDGSYVRVKNISLSYKISDQFLLFKNAEIYVSVSNIFTLHKYLGYDPEFGFSHADLSGDRLWPCTSAQAIYGRNKSWIITIFTIITMIRRIKYSPVYHFHNDSD